MGFKSLTEFNVALVAKQCWRLITRPQCLLAQVLKARYYPNDNLLNANLGSNPSYVWRSIWNAKGLIEKGRGWRIDNGQHINIWNEPWLSGPSGGFLKNQAINCNYTLVSDLIDNTSGTWKIANLELIFDEEHVRKICAISLANAGLTDEVI
ncbi:hypothetical protein like AT4G29090 [Hibiscus trionum]|uniref:Uncharacterized protein n=1 Tax=Hibiscus trionum TaxID=183268 RepID=A0A9W7J144_HIBTR|nr:hypothetical protein like AT4G29090 [Hibiscus trionum]